MKRDGQWISWLWVSLALVWPQTPALSRLALDTTDGWEISRGNNQLLFGDLQPLGLKKTETRSGEEQDPSNAPHGTPLHHPAPVFFVSETVAVLSERPVFTNTPGLPFSCGPPTRV